MADWTVAYLRAAGIKPTPEARARLQQWQRWEGGSTNNTARNNYLNSKLRMPGSWDAIGNGVQGYTTLAHGALAFARTLNGLPVYEPLKQWLSTGQGDPSHALGVWVAGPGGATSRSAQTYAAKVLGTAPPAPTPAAPDVAQPGSQAPAAAATPTLSIRDQARQNLADIAAGTKPTDTLASLASAHQADLAAGGQPSSSNDMGVTLPSLGRGASPLDRQAVTLARKYLGVKYTWGGTTPQTGFDCSGLVQYIWKTMGVSVPRTTYEQWDKGKPVSDLRPGDALFFTGSDPQGGKPGHEGIYIGDGKFIEAPGSGKQVRISTLAGRNDFVGARRFA